MANDKSSMRRVFEFAGSVRIGVVLLIVLAGASVSGTLVLQSPFPGVSPEWLASHYGERTGSVLRALGLTDVFHSPWYLALMGLVALNVLCATVLRWSLRPARLGFLLAHLGVLLVLLGGLLYFVRGDRGVLDLAEGDSTRIYYSLRDGNFVGLGFSVRLDRFDMDYYPAQLVVASTSAGTMTLTPRAGVEMTMASDGTRIRVERVLGHAERTDEVVPGGGPPLNPAARLTVQSENETVTLWRFALRQCAADTLVESNGCIAVAFDTPDTLRTRPVSPDCALYVINRSAGKVMQVPPLVGEKFQLPGVEPVAQGEILRVFGDADNTALGPGLRIQLEGRGNLEWRHVFARLPGFIPDALVGRSSELSGVEFIYYRPKLILDVVEKPGPSYDLRSWTDGVWRTRSMEPGRPVTVGPVRLTLLEVLPSAHVETRYEPSGERTGVEAVLLDVKTPGGEPRRIWLSTGGRDRVAAVSDTVALGYAASRHVREYTSNVTLDDNTTGPVAAHVRVNHPVRFRGLRLFQEGYLRDRDGDVSRLTVTRDPGLATACVGLVMLITGVFYACFVKPVILKRKAQS